MLRDPDFRCRDSENLQQLIPDWRSHPSLVQVADWLLSLNGARHARIRSLFSRTFTARRVASLEPAIIAMADKLLDAMADRGCDGGTVEFVHDFAYLLPVTVICELIGIPEQDRESFRPLARDLARVFESSDESDTPVINAAAVELLAYFTGLAARRRAEPGGDLISSLLAAAGAGDGELADAELLHNLTLLLVAGFETTTNLLGNGLQILLHDPAEAAALRSDAVRPAQFVEEVLRFDSPVQAASRLGYPSRIGVVDIADGDRVMMLLGAGNRDPRRFAEPDSFRPLRPDGGSLSFGGGPHFCIGAALARLEGRIAFLRLMTRFPALAPAGQPARRHSFLLRGFDALPVTIS